MQLADQVEDTNQKMSASINSALIDSLFEARSTVLTGIVFSTIAAAMTALKTGQGLIWAFVPLLLVAGAFRAFDWRRYQARKSSLTAEEAEGLIQKRLSDGGFVKNPHVTLFVD